MAAQARLLDTLRRYFRDDCAARDSGAEFTTDHVDEQFKATEASLCTMLQDSEYAGGPASGDWWDVVYRSSAIACGTITVQAAEGGAPATVFVTDTDRQRTFRKSALVSWILAVVEDTFYSVGRSSAYARRVPWCKIGIVHRETNKNMHTHIAMHKSRLEARATAPSKRTRQASPPAPRKRVMPPPAKVQAQLTLETFTPGSACAVDAEDAAVQAAELENEIAEYKRQIAELELTVAAAELAEVAPPPCVRDTPREKQVTDADLAQLRQFLQVGARILDNLTGKMDACGD
jgi:hypothetical protein